MTDRVEIDLLRPQAFLSYARADDRFLRGAISRLRVDLEEAVGFVSARPFRIFQDTDGIGFGQDWLDRLDEALRQARFLIPILTPRYFASEPCRAEAFRFFEYEAAAMRNDLVLPIYVQDTPLVNDVNVAANDDLATLLAERQHRDWRGLIHAPTESEQLRSGVILLAREISEVAVSTVSVTHQKSDDQKPAFKDRLLALRAQVIDLEKKIKSGLNENEYLANELASRDQELANQRRLLEEQVLKTDNAHRKVDLLRVKQNELQVKMKKRENWLLANTQNKPLGIPVLISLWMTLILTILSCVAGLYFGWLMSN